MFNISPVILPPVLVIVQLEYAIYPEKLFPEWKGLQGTLSKEWKEVHVMNSFGIVKYHNAPRFMALLENIEDIVFPHLLLPRMHFYHP